MNHHRVREGAGRGREPLAAADHLRERIEIAFDGEQPEAVDRALRARAATHSPSQSAIVAGRNCASATRVEFGRQARGEVRAGIDAAQLMAQRVRETAERGDEAARVGGDRAHRAG